MLTPSRLLRCIHHLESGLDIRLPVFNIGLTFSLRFLTSWVLAGPNLLSALWKFCAYTIFDMLQRKRSRIKSAWARVQIQRLLLLEFSVGTPEIGCHHSVP